MLEECTSSLDVAVVGAGFAGLYPLHNLLQSGFEARAFEAAAGVGGTWYWNRYPGARCDVQSLVYCYTFDEELYRQWHWSERYATQPEILRYLNFVMDKLGRRKDIEFECAITEAAFDAGCNLWTLSTSGGVVARARYLIMATGALSATKPPGTEGLEFFKGECYHTGEWPQTPVSFAGKRVGIVGTGSSAVQAIPLIAQEARQLVVFQRTPSFVAPARNGSIQPSEEDQLRQHLSAFRDLLRRGVIVGVGDLTLEPRRPEFNSLSRGEQDEILSQAWAKGGLALMGAFANVLTDPATNEAVADFVRARIRDIVKDPQTAELLTPRGFPFGAKRVSVGTNYYESFNRDNVLLVDIQRLAGARSKTDFDETYWNQLWRWLGQGGAKHVQPISPPSTSQV